MVKNVCLFTRCLSASVALLTNRVDMYLSVSGKDPKGHMNIDYNNDVQIERLSIK